MTTQDELKAVIAKHSQRLLATPGVSGVGIERDGAGDLMLTVYITGQDARTHLPDTLDDYRVQYVITNPFRKM
jgi:hypothetical protein